MKHLVDNHSTSITAKLFVWLARLLVGATFTLSGWAKSIDPWGFIYKIEEYFNVWGVFVPREITLALALIISITEFIVGVLVLTGSMRRVSIWIAGGFMLGLLPLTAYIAIDTPVADCGCFGDFLLISNWATFAKNVILSILIIALARNNARVGGMIAINLQSLVVFGALSYSMILAFIGYRYQPVMDFRPYTVGTELVFSDEDDDGNDSFFIYEKEGLKKEFSINDIPDSTWTFVDVVNSNSAADESAGLTVYDHDGADITAEVFDGVGEQLFLAVINPGIHYLTRARLANELYDYVKSRGGRMSALVAAQGDDLAVWQQLALPSYPVYSAEDTALKELVRGDAGLIYVKDGKIVWKRNMASVSHDIIQTNGDFLDAESSIVNSHFHLYLTLIFALWLCVLYLIGVPNRILKLHLRRRSIKN